MTGVWLFIIFGIIIFIIVLFLIFSPLLKKQSLASSKTPLPEIKPLVSPWKVTNATWPLDPVPDPNPICPICQLYTFTSPGSFEPPRPRIQDLPDCLQSGACVKEPCLNPYYNCYWPDQVGAFLGSHTCISGPSGYAGTGCLNQYGQIVPVGTVETIYDSCGNNAYPPCIDPQNAANNITYGMFVMNWNLTSINIQENQNPLSEMFCLQADDTLMSQNPTVSVQTCDITINNSSNSQLWIFKSYSFTNVVGEGNDGLIADKNGSFFSIQNRQTGGYLIPKSYDPVTKIFDYPSNVVSGDSDVELVLYGANARESPKAVCWYLVRNFSTPKDFVYPNQDVFLNYINQGSQIGSMFLFVPDFTKFPSPVFQADYVSTLLTTCNDYLFYLQSCPSNSSFYISPKYNYRYSNPKTTQNQADPTTYTKYNLFLANVGGVWDENLYQYKLTLTGVPYEYKTHTFGPPDIVALDPDPYLNKAAIVTPYMNFVTISDDAWMSGVPYVYQNILSYTDYNYNIEVAKSIAQLGFL